MHGKKLSLAAIMLFISILAFIVAPLVASAGDAVMDRKVISLSTTTGLGGWTQNVETANIELQRISVKADVIAVDTVTVTRVTGETVAETNTVVAIVTASNAGSSNLLHVAGGPPVYMKRGDKLTFASSSSGATTGATVYVEYLIQSR
jgi:hypothetical protein